MTDICLISPPSRAYNHYRPPLALMLISSYLSKNGVDTRIIDFKSDTGDETDRKRIISGILEKVRECSPLIVGLPCYTPEYKEIMDLAKLIKSSNPSLKIAVGGVHATIKPGEFFFEGSPVDFVVIGEGEYTLLELVKSVKERSDPSNVRGIAFYDRSLDKYVQTEGRPLIHNLDEMPFPDYSKVDMKYYTTPNPYNVRGMLLSSFYILVGRGCPSQCTFCVSAQLRKIMSPGKSLRCRSAKNVVDEIELLKNMYKIDGFYFIDDNFTLLPKLVEAICDEILARRLSLMWACSSRINTLSKDLLLKMQKAGCFQIDLGVETGSEAVLKRLRKGITVKQIKEVFRLCHKIGMRTFCNILINIPDETKEELMETLRLLDEIRPSVTSFNIFIPFLGTEIYDNSGLNLMPSDYNYLSMPPRELVKDKRFRFAKHDIDFSKFYSQNHKKYNSPYVFLPSYFSKPYLKQLIKSKRKKDYIFQVGLLIKEFFKQISQ